MSLKEGHVENSKVRL